jgi:hypothetical protein
MIIDTRPSSAPVAREIRQPVADAELMTPQEYARYRRCSLRTLDRERAVGQGCPYVRIGNRILYRRGDIERFIEAHVRGANIHDQHTDGGGQ